MSDDTQTKHTNQYLLEVGTEELPSSFLSSAPDELQEMINRGASLLTRNQPAAGGTLAKGATLGKR